jgi:hypothetical protein
VRRVDALEAAEADAAAAGLSAAAGNTLRKVQVRLRSPPLCPPCNLPCLALPCPAQSPATHTPPTHCAAPCELPCPHHPCPIPPKSRRTSYSILHTLLHTFWTHFTLREDSMQRTHSHPTHVCTRLLPSSPSLPPFPSPAGGHGVPRPPPGRCRGGRSSCRRGAGGAAAPGGTCGRQRLTRGGVCCPPGLHRCYAAGADGAGGLGWGGVVGGDHVWTFQGGS